MKKEIELKEKTLIVRVSKAFHTEIKSRSVFRGMSISDWVCLAIQERINEEDKRK